MIIENTTKDYGKQSAEQTTKQATEQEQLTLDYKILPLYFCRKFLLSLLILSLLFIAACGKTGKLYLPNPQNEASQNNETTK